MYRKALELGAEPITPRRTRDLLAHIKRRDEMTLLVAPGKMGEQYMEGIAMPFTVIGEIDKETSAEDTKRIAGEMVDRGIELLIFAGGDGTARDVYDAIGSEVPVVGVPAGVKVFSSAFALSAKAAAEMVDAFVEGTDVTEEEVLNIDEDAFREDRLASRLYGYLLVPEVRRLLQPRKAGSSVSKSSKESKLELIRKVGAENDYRDLLSGNGFIFGRGSKQFTPDVIRQVGRNNVMAVGTREAVIESSGGLRA